MSNEDKTRTNVTKKSYIEKRKEIESTIEFRKKKDLENFLKSNFDFINDCVSNKLFFKEKKAPSEEFKEVHIATLLDYVRDNVCYKVKGGFSSNWNEIFLIQLIESEKFIPPTNPLKNWFESLKKEEHPHEVFENLANYVILENTEERSFLLEAFKKWFVGAVQSVYEIRFVQKQILVFRSTKENTGKTRFSNYLLPNFLDRYKSTETHIATKDAELALASNLIIHFDEIDQFLCIEQNRSAFKSYVSRQSLNLRRPFSKSPVSRPRIASFIATCNSTEFISQATGETRFVVFDVHRICNRDWFEEQEKYKKKLPKFPPFEDFPIEKIWAASLQLYKQGYKAYYSFEESEELKQRNKVYSFSCEVTDLLLKVYANTEKENQDAVFLTSSEILSELNQENPNVKINVIRLGRVLSKNGFIKSQKRINNKPIYGYWVKRINEKLYNSPITFSEKNHPF